MDTRDCGGEFSNHVFKRLIERNDSEAALNPVKALLEIVKEEGRKHPLDWLKFWLWTRKRRPNEKDK